MSAACSGCQQPSAADLDRSAQQPPTSSDVGSQLEDVHSLGSVEAIQANHILSAESSTASAVGQPSIQFTAQQSLPSTSFAAAGLCRRRSRGLHQHVSQAFECNVAGLPWQLTRALQQHVDSIAVPGLRLFSTDSTDRVQPATPSQSDPATLQGQQPGYQQKDRQAGQGPAAPEQLRGVVLSRLPQWAVPYAQLMRLDKPTGTWLLLWPCVWSISLAAQPGHLPDLWMLTLFTTGAVLLRGAGCTVNDLWDRDLDAKVERTRTRPIASGAVTPMQGIGLLGAQLALGLVILLQLNDYSKVLGASSLLLVGTYPLMKRITYWPQAFLGLTINWGALLGWAAVRGSCDWGVVLPLYAAGFFWSLIYDTIYAHQDKKDDAVVGVRSTALLFGDKGTKPVLTAFTAAQVAALWGAGAAADVGPLYYAGVAAMAAHLLQQIWTVDLSDGKDCMDKFVSNKVAGAILAAGCVAGRLWN